MVSYIAAGDNLNLPFVGQFTWKWKFSLFAALSVVMVFILVFKEYLYSILLAIHHLNTLLKVDVWHRPLITTENRQVLQWC